MQASNCSVYVSKEKALDNLFGSESATRTANVNGNEIARDSGCAYLFFCHLVEVFGVDDVHEHRSPPLDYVDKFGNRWTGVDLCDIVECGTFGRYRSQFGFTLTHIYFGSHICRALFWMQMQAVGWNCADPTLCICSSEHLTISQNDPTETFDKSMGAYLTLNRSRQMIQPVQENMAEMETGATGRGGIATRKINGKHKNHSWRDSTGGYENMLT